MELRDLRLENKSSIGYFKGQINSGDFVLDIGTKHGEKLMDVPGTVVGIDISKSEFDRESPVEFALADATDQPFPADTFDFVYCDQVLEHVRDTERVVAEAARVLKSEGIAFFGFPNRFSLRQPHSVVPRWYSLLPRPLGKALSPYLLDESAEEYYERALFPLSPVGARRYFHRHFDDVVYPMRLDPESVTDSLIVQRAIWWINSAVALPPFCWVGELFWSASTYLCAVPKRE